ncbi:alpha/beta fold hydrolase [Psychromonas ossibalaenae]|uniref:alpha/beta fold hydrolase n=1 Tax=Psychromonas ossibalaenae TaxID=444922 RepID=UPI000363BED3|nr:alpha/beta hydrolase [Psychromonas ossibalaenae]
MLRRLSIYLLLLLISACSSQQQKQPIPVAAAESDQAELQPAEHWQLSYFDEPIFNSKVAVLEAGNKHNPPVILIHGLGQLGMKDWFSVIPTLEKNYHVIALDLPGFGLSADAEGRFLPTNYARVIAAVNRQYNNEKAIIIGHSMGAAVALRYTELYAESVKQLILVDAAGLLEKSAFIKHIAAFEFGDDLPVFVQRQIKGLNEFSSSMVEAGTKNTSITNFLQENDYAWNWLVSDSSNMNAALSLVEEDFSQAVAQVDVPVNIIWGDKDNVAPLRTGKVLNKQMINARLQVIKGAGHVPMKSHHAEFISTLETALNESITEQSSLANTGQSQGILACRGQSDKTYSGHYDEIVMQGCDNIRLVNISTDRLFIKGSVVDIENLSFNNTNNQLEFNESVVTITNADISGHNTMLINGSRLDMAGVSIKATGDAVMIGNGSRISVSLSDINSPEYKGVVHGAFYLKNQPLTGQ